MKKLESLIKTYNDFPKKGIAFKDLLEIIQDSEVFRELIFQMSSNKIIKSSIIVISIPKILIIFVCLSFNIEKNIIIGILNVPNNKCLTVK